MTETAVETLRARGEPARFERLLGEILVGLDRAGQLRRLASATLAPSGATGAAETPTSRGRTTTIRPSTIPMPIPSTTIAPTIPPPTTGPPVERQAPTHPATIPRCPR